ncbi:hypothetical protein HYFRA_00007889 [Hymenoscyphus fraxineus]|uniref:Uncharacterized protein n=1 Tax=Hymenoscyphus fraxineus TaxID=746836 RepID=A0A9N9PN60_9HELO|nr:hypothetical protein HYFRA_00007889 [Hymenoscyphus fraxineus]
MSIVPNLSDHNTNQLSPEKISKPSRYRLCASPTALSVSDHISGQTLSKAYETFYNRGKQQAHQI